MQFNPSRTAAALKARTPLRPSLAMVLGSGFHGVLDRVEVVHEFAYSALKGFPVPSVHGHGGRLILGRLGGATVLILSGRSHYYEGHDLATVTFPVRVLAAFGVRSLLLTNAAGGINRRFRLGDFMCLSDHMNFMGTNPLRGWAEDGLPRFLDLTGVYDSALAKLLTRAARKVRLKLLRGVYMALSGPTYETPAEVRAFGKLGADAVGMSTVPEAIVARQCGLRVAGLSCITNLAAGISPTPLSHDEVLSTGKKVQAQAGALLENFARYYAQTY